MTNNSPDEDPILTSFLRQHRSIAPSASSELEERLLSEIDLLPLKQRPKFLSSWRRYLVGGIAIIVTGIVGVTIHQLVNPPELSVAELNDLNLYLESHARGLVGHPPIGVVSHGNLADLDADLFN